ncbi:MAG: polyprenyl synthetase family protein [Proteobacteria bacterium]|nr:polyprenyl synthetase family protein [Pseudomonadota bacterium]MBU1612424.1 polyprenyl synthetase family protein [Pseudomonadota bacterium]
MIELKTYFSKELPGINRFLESETAKLDGLVQQVAAHVLLGGGKRIRPILTMATARALGCAETNLLPMACALEMLHTATLLHDDVLDGAELRRGTRAAHLKFGVNETILSGDVLLALANQLGASYGKARISWLLAEGIMATATGEVMEIATLGTPEVDRQTYLDIIIGKTAKLIETACCCGAVLATDDPAAEDAAGAFGLNLGIAFQLVDDALDYVSRTENTGKAVGGDLREGKVTLPLILLLEQMDGSEAASLLAKLRESTLTDQEINSILATVDEKGYAAATRQEAADYILKAKTALAFFPDGLEKNVLEQAADFVLAREK